MAAPSNNFLERLIAKWPTTGAADQHVEMELIERRLLVNSQKAG
jgi:hypothetical protein